MFAPECNLIHNICCAKIQLLPNLYGHLGFHLNNVVTKKEVIEEPNKIVELSFESFTANYMNHSSEKRFLHSLELA